MNDLPEAVGVATMVSRPWLSSAMARTWLTVELLHPHSWSEPVAITWDRGGEGGSKMGLLGRDLLQVGHLGSELLVLGQPFQELGQPGRP